MIEIGFCELYFIFTHPFIKTHRKNEKFYISIYPSNTNAIFL